MIVTQVLAMRALVSVAADQGVDDSDIRKHQIAASKIVRCILSRGLNCSDFDDLLLVAASCFIEHWPE